MPEAVTTEAGTTETGTTETGTSEAATSPPDDVSETAGRLRIAVARLARKLRQQNVGSLGPTSDAALASIEREGPLTLGELAAIEQIAPPSVTRLIGKLEDAGFVERRFDQRDRRVCRVEVTEAGRRQVVDNRRRRHEWLAGRLEQLPDADRVRIAQALDVLERLA